MVDPDTLGSWAAHYAAQGLAVLPLRPGTKIPLQGSKGAHGASCDPELVGRWWAATPQANVGIATGGLVDVIDIDGPDGVASWMRSAPDWPEIIGQVRTPRGVHLYIPADPEMSCAAGLWPGVDYRGQGGYVVAPGSRLDERPEIYTWTAPLQLERLQHV